MRSIRPGYCCAMAALVVCATALGCGGGDQAELSGSVGGEGGDAGTDVSPGTCGNGVVDGEEECDDGNPDLGDGCENDCRFTCVAGTPGRDTCSDGNDCNGLETCSEFHRCIPGAPLAEGAVCGTDLVCVNGNCVPASCGDGQVEAPEECDDGNAEGGDGCETTCKYTCVSTDPSRDCTPEDECEGPAICLENTHRCSPRTPMAEGAPCNGGAGYCALGVCTAPLCGNQVVEPGETCDDGNTDDADGCRADCTFSCDSAQQCDDGSVCTTDECDASAHTCTSHADSSKDGDACTTRGLDGTCAGGECVPVGCGNGVVDASEECDLGASVNGQGSGCTKTCELECHTPEDCDDGNACNGIETCVGVTGGKACKAGTPLALHSLCSDSPRGICDSNGVCAPSVCGDQYVDTGAGEQCDDGNTDATDGCRNDCKLTCTGAGDCADGNPCTQDVCSASHTCSNPPDVGTEGSVCTVGGASGSCKSGSCVPVQCGDGLAGPGEECDNGSANNGPGTGCTAACQFECDTDADCNDGNPCDGQETCTVVAGGKICVGGTSQPAGTLCAASPRRICDIAGNCVLSTCGDGWIDSSGGEECDKGANGVGTGCTTACLFECHSAGDCIDANPCNGDESCVDTAGGKTCAAGTALQAGTVCGASPRMLCDSSHACVASVCGDGWLDTVAGEECDNGTANNGTGTGCTAMCQFECDTAADCADGNLCNGDELCVTVTGGRRCQAGALAGQGTLCNASPRRICDANGSCLLSVCGDGWLDIGAGELCEPPNTASCDAACKPITPVVCGDGVIDGAEQCDNSIGNLDGCNTSCKVELFMRANPITVVRGTAPAWCDKTANRFGSAFSSDAVDILNSSLQSLITAGKLNVLLQALGLDDPTGTADSSFEFGVTSGLPDSVKGIWPATEPTDWWFLLYADSVDSSKLPKWKVTPGSLSAHAYAAGGTGSVTLKHMFGATSVLLEMLNPRTNGRFDPTTSAVAPPPSPIATGLTFVESMTANGTAEGACGNITVEALSKIPAPAGFMSGDNACRAPGPICDNTHEYTYCGDGQPVTSSCHSLLDILVGGCKKGIGCDTVVTAVQPDVNNGGVSLSLDSNHKVPSSQVTGNKNAYSSFFRYRAKRQRVTGTQ